MSHWRPEEWATFFMGIALAISALWNNVRINRNERNNQIRHQALMRVVTGTPPGLDLPDPATGKVPK